MKQIVLILFLLLPTCMFAQLFKAGFVGGASLMQVEGDDIAGYDQIGFNAGLIVDAGFWENSSISMEILFAQKGAESGGLERSIGTDIKIVWDYIEIPIVFHYKDKNGMDFGAGLAPARLVRQGYWINGVEDLTEFEENPPKSWDFGLLLNLGYNINHFLQANLRWTYSLAPVRTDENSNLESKGQFNNVVNLRMVVMFSGIGKKRL